MLTTALVLALLALLAWAALALDRGRRWPREHVLPADVRPKGRAVEVRAVVPARNEGERLPATLPTLLAQAPLLRSVTVVDDRSTDETAEIAAAFGRDAAVDVDVVRVADLPAGWAGKVHAMERGVRSLAGRWRAPPPDRYVFFTDADIAHPPDGVARFLARAATGPYDLVSVMARLRAEGFWEKVLIPAFVYFFQAMYPFRRSSDPRSRVASAAGGAMLVRLASLEAAGGCTAWKAARIDDLALARGIKDAGGRLWTGFATDVVSTRAYPTLSSLVDMVARSAFEELRRRLALVPLVWIVLVLVFVVPPLAFAVGAVLGEGRLWGLGAAAWGLQLSQVLPAFRHHGVAAPWALTMPVAAILYAWMTTVSAWRSLRGRDRGWRAPDPETAR